MATVRIDASEILDFLTDAPTKAQVAIKMYAQQGATKFQNYAKQNAPWKNRTGMARKMLIGWVEILPSKTRIHIGHGVSYGVYLELCHERKYAILKPTVNAMSAEVLRGYEGLMKHIK